MQGNNKIDCGKNGVRSLILNYPTIIYRKFLLVINEFATLQGCGLSGRNKKGAFPGLPKHYE